MAARSDGLASLVRVFDDWPRAGVRFHDVTPLLADAGGLRQVVTAIADHFAHGIVDAGGGPVTHVAGIEARGFPVAAPVALRLDAGFLPVRRAGRLPAEVESAECILEYGTELLEMQRAPLHPGSSVLIVDDVLGTGATAEAVVRMVRRCGGEVAGYACVAEVAADAGRERLGDVPVLSVLRVESGQVLPGVDHTGRGV